MTQEIKSKIGIFLCICMFHWNWMGVRALETNSLFNEVLGNFRQINEILRPISNQQTKVVFPIPEDVIKNRSYLPDLGVLTDLMFLILPRDFPASGMARLSRDVFESEECVQYVGCEMTKLTQRYESLYWVRNFLQDFPAQGDFVERLRQGSQDAIARLEEKKTVNGSDSGSENKNDKTQPGEICTFSCHPIKSLSRGLKILSLLHDLVRTVK